MIPFPMAKVHAELDAARPVSCLVCMWSTVSGDGTFCSLFTEQVEDERATAEDCTEYQDDKAKG